MSPQYNNSQFNGGGGAGTLPPSTTAGDLIYLAARSLGILSAPGRGNSPETEADGLVMLNQLLDSWNTERLAVFHYATRSYPLVAGQQEYTLGPGGDFDQVRPQRIERANIIISQPTAQPLRQPVAILTNEQWASQFPVRNVTATYPTCLYCDDAFPLANVYMFPVPSTVTEVELYYYALLEGFADTTTPVILPPGYALALQYCLAEAMIPMAMGQVKVNRIKATSFSKVEELARRYKAAILRSNVNQRLLTCDPALIRPNGGYWNWYTGSTIPQN